MTRFPLLDVYDEGHLAIPSSEASNSEEADDYAGVVLVLNRHWRIIACRDGIQWILQRRAGFRHGKTRWDSKCYCRTRNGLASCVRELVGAEAVNALASLPARIEGRIRE